jgi:arylsulfatase A-like enzyme
MVKSGVVLLFVLAGMANLPFHAAAQPNVILICTDDQGYGDLSCHGNPILKTPQLDRLYSQSVRLTNFHVDPTCSPTRAALMTGRYSHRVKVWHTIMGRNYLPRSEKTMADIFKANGYATGQFGKWHLGGEYPYAPMYRGFDEWVGHGDAGTSTTSDYWGNDKFNDHYMRNGKWEKFEGFATDIFVDETMEFIRAKKDKPFFIYLATNVAHTPWNVKEEWMKPYVGKVDDKTARFFATIDRLDMNMGRLMDFLQEEGLERNTIVVYMSDNGTAGGSKVFNAGMSGHKGSPNDGGHRVPCFIRWPGGGFEHGREINGLTAHFDLMPTFIEMCGLKNPDIAFDGISLIPWLKDPSLKWNDRTLVVESQRIPVPLKGRKYAVMSENWRLVVGKQLYDVSKDPGQKKDVSKEHPEVVERLNAAYERYWNDVTQGDEGYFSHVVIGALEHPETMLNGGDWLPALTQKNEPTVWAQGFVQRGKESNGFWPVEFDSGGTYRFELRRWPRETDSAITSGKTPPLQKDCIGVSPQILEGKGKALPIKEATLLIDGKEWSKPVVGSDKAIVFEVPVKQGEVRLKTAFMDGSGKELCGAYYVYVTKVK